LYSVAFLSLTKMLTTVVGKYAWLVSGVSYGPRIPEGAL
jgi:hypothetical protein